MINCMSHKSTVLLLQQQHHYCASKMSTHTGLSLRKGSLSSSDSELEDIPIKNIETGQSESSAVLLKGSQQLSIQNGGNRQWEDYFKDIHSLQDKLLGRVIRREREDLEGYLAEYPVELSQMRYMDGWSLLHFAVSQDDTKTAHLLLKFGLQVDLMTKEMKRTPLHEATLANRVEMVQLLVEWGANPNALDSDRNTPLHMAVDHSYPEIVKALMGSPTRLDLTQRNCMNMTPFNTCRNPQIFEMLENYASKFHKADASTFATLPSKAPRKKIHHDSRLVKSDSHYVPHSTRSDQVEKFLSLRQGPQKRPNNSSEFESISIISEESADETSSSSPTSSKRNSRNKSYLRSRALLRNSNKVRQNLGLAKQSMLMTHLQNQEQVDNYDILRKIGSGAFGQVFLVRRKRSSNLYAMKRIEKRQILEHGLQGYIYAEKKVYTQMKHPFIVRAEHCLQDMKHLYLLMEFCVHGDLSQHIRTHPLPQRIAKTYFCEAALALEALHAQKMLYRDLKVANVLVDTQGHIKLTDFGLSKEGVVAESFVGSVGYVAPELLVESNAKPHGPELDWYLLGIFLYELLHGEPPFYNENTFQMQQSIKEMSPKIESSISTQCQEVISLLLNKDPHSRPAGLADIKKLTWMQDVDWLSIIQRKGQVMELEPFDLKELRRKQYDEEEGSGAIDQKIEWFEDWNYPPRQSKH